VDEGGGVTNIYARAIERVREAMPDAEARRSGAVLLVTVGPKAAYMTAEYVAQVDDETIRSALKGQVGAR
jgi:hypothetical protein